MGEKQKNPFFVLGVDYGASTGAATAAFGRASKRVRRAGDQTFTVEDLTTALSQIEEAHRNGDVEGLGDYFRVPADPQAYEVEAEDGLLLLPVIPQPRKTSPIGVDSIEQMKRTVVAQAVASLFDSLERQVNAYDLGVPLGGDISLDQAAPSMASELSKASQEALNALSQRIPTTSDPEQLALWARAISQSGQPIPAVPARALILNPATSIETDRSLLSSEHFPLSVAQELAASPTIDPRLLEILAGNENIPVRQAVAANPATPPDTLEKLRKDTNQNVRKAASRKKPWVTWAKIGGAVLLIALILLTIALVTGYVKIQFDRTSAGNETPEAVVQAAPASDYPEVTATQWNRIVSNPSNFINDRLTFYGQVVGMGRKPPAGQVTVVADALYRQPSRYSKTLYTGDQSWISMSRAEGRFIHPNDQLKIEGVVVGETKFKEGGEVSRIPWFRAESVGYAE